MNANSVSNSNLQNVKKIDVKKTILPFRVFYTTVHTINAPSIVFSLDCYRVKIEY